MSAIGPGDYVECVRSRSLVVGAVYVVESLFPSSGMCPCHGYSPGALTLRRIPNRRGIDGWCILNFRPIYRPKQELFETLLTPVELGEKVDA